MKKEWIPIMIQTGKLKMKFADMLNHYFIALFLFLPMMFSLFSLFQKYVLENYDGIRSPEELIRATSPFGIFAILFFFIQKNRLRFKSIETNLSKDKVKEIIEATAKQLEWCVEIVDETIVVARTYPKWWSGSWGEMITIIFDNSRIMVNSICDPDKHSSVVSMRRNKKNIDTLIQNIKTASS